MSFFVAALRSNHCQQLPTSLSGDHFLPQNLTPILLAIVTLCSLIYSRLTPRSGSVHLFFSAPSEVLARSSSDFGDDRQLIDILRSKADSLFNPQYAFSPVLWLFGGHAQTIYTSMSDDLEVDEIEYERTLIRLSDGGTLAIDVVPSDSTSSNATSPVLLVTHGLTGGSHEAYVRAAIKHLTSLRLDCGVTFAIVVLNSRGCNQTPVTSPKLSHAGVTDDIRHAILWISASFPTSPIYGLGFSVGANTLTKYAGEEGDTCPLSAIVSVANVWDFVRGSRYIEHGPAFSFGWLYSLVLGNALRNLLSTHREAFKNSPHSSQLGAIFKSRFVTLRQYHDSVTSLLYGFAGADDYYAQISSARYISKIRIPFLGLNAADDPVTGPDTLPVCDALANPWIVLAQTDKGGHLGWFERGPDGAICKWYVKPVGDFLRAMVDYNLAPRPQIKVEYLGDTVRQHGRTDISYVEVR
ncbi:AB-hydrolase YheT [Dentipellis sp. KUC8613]|nr:AB-hydrolase YheT [Dentipellis sp. KUC8613]